MPGSIKGCIERLGGLAWFRASRAESVGAYWQDSSVWLVRLACEEGEWRIAGQEAAEASLLTEEAGDELLAEKTVSVCRVRGWADDALSICLPPEDAYLLELHLPPGMEEEAGEAVRWEVDGQGPFGEAAFCSSYLRLSEADAYGAGAIASARADAIEACCRRSGAGLRCLTVRWGTEEVPPALAAWAQAAGEGFCGALHAALAGIFPEPGRYLNFLPPGEAERWNWKRLSAAVAAASLLLCMAVSGVDAWRYYDALHSLKAQEAQWAMMRTEREKKEWAERTEADVAAREQALQSLGSKALPWRSVLVHLGTLTTEGAWLESLELGADGTVLLEGGAVAYGAMSDVLERLETDRDFFRKEPVLLHSAMEQGQAAAPQVTFSLQLGL